MCGGVDGGLIVKAGYFDNTGMLQCDASRNPTGKKCYVLNLSPFASVREGDVYDLDFVFGRDFEDGTMKKGTFFAESVYGRVVAKPNLLGRFDDHLRSRTSEFSHGMMQDRSAYLSNF